MYQYQATVTRIVDGDTIHAELDLGCDVRINLTLRLYGINAPETSTPEGKDATAFLRSLVVEGDTVLVVTYKDRREKYGRYLATLFDAEGRDVNHAMVEAGHAVPYFP